MAETSLPHRALCPICGRLAIRETSTAKGDVIEAIYSCDRGHLWQSRWVKEVAA